MCRSRFIQILAVLVVATLVIFYFITGHLSHRFYPLYGEAEGIIKENAHKYSVEASLVAAIIYEESKFDPDVVSKEDAIGLMQILPDTANLIAKELGVTNLKRDELFEPAVNVRFGTYYFKSLVDRYDGDIDLALSAYNAGHGKVDKVGKDISKLPEETQEFVERVKKTNEVYKYLYKDELESEKSDLNWFGMARLTWGKIIKIK